MLLDERSFGAALPETRKEHKEKSDLCNEKHRPDSLLREHKHGGAGEEETCDRSQGCKQQKGEPRADKVIAE